MRQSEARQAGKKSEPSNLWSRNKVAKLAGVCTRTIINMEKSGLLKGVKIGKKLVRYTEESVEAFLAGGVK